VRNTYQLENPNSRLFSKPDIVLIIGERVELRRQRKEYIGLCPFHSDKNPSLSVNEEKGLFHCWSCQESGDVFDFVMAFDGIGFVEAKRLLNGGDDTGYSPRRQAAQDARRWALRQREKLDAWLRELDEELWLSDELGDSQLSESIWIERQILADLRDDLDFPQNFTEMKELIENIIESWA